MKLALLILEWIFNEVTGFEGGEPSLVQQRQKIALRGTLRKD